MLTMDDLDLGGKRVLLRVDINTPVHPETGRLMERERLEEAAETVKDLGASKVIVASHQGRVGRSDYVSLEPHSRALEEIVQRRVDFVPDIFGPEALSRMDSLPDGGVLVLDNLRFTAEENQEYSAPDAERT